MYYILDLILYVNPISKLLNIRNHLSMGQFWCFAILVDADFYSKFENHSNIH